MALLDYLRPNYPTVRTDSAGRHKTYVMRGPADTLNALYVGVGSVFDSGRVETTDITPVDMANGIIDYTITTVVSFTHTTETVTDDQYPYYEVDQVQIEKNLRQHPEFISFSSSDWAAIEAWEAEVDQTLKAAYKYYARNADGKKTGDVLTLSTQECRFAYLRLRGVESYPDYSPVVRKTSKYIGTTAPDSSEIGQKTTTPTYAPSGYEWRKSADRINKQGRGIEWIRQEEWIGAVKVLVDKDDIFV